MIIWLASYPRSGNTMFRMMLNKVFGSKTYTKYFFATQPHNRNEDIRKPTGQTPLPGPWAECYEPFTRDGQVYERRVYLRLRYGLK